MARRAVEIIVLKQLASCLATPMFVVGPEGNIVFFNESAEPILGRRFDEMGGVTAEEWASLVQLTNERGEPIKDEHRPLPTVLARREPSHRRFWVHGLDGKRRKVEGTGIPLLARDGRLLGALGMFWELEVKLDGTSAEPRKRTGQHAVEVILMRRLADCLAVPIFIVGSEGHLIHFNQAAEPLFGRPLEDAMSLTREALYASVQPTDEDGSPIEPASHPIVIARERHEPAHQRFWIRGLDGLTRKLEATAIPLIGQSQRTLGAVCFFWEIGNS